MNSTWLITSELANQRARKVLFTCVVYTNKRYLVRVTLNSKADKPVAVISGSNWNLECWFLWGEENRRTRRKTLGTGTRTNNKLNPHMTPGPGVEHGPQRWEASALTTALSMLPQLFRSCPRNSFRNTRSFENGRMSLGYFPVLNSVHIHTVDLESTAEDDHESVR